MGVSLRLNLRNRQALIVDLIGGQVVTALGFRKHAKCNDCKITWGSMLALFHSSSYANFKLRIGGFG